MHQIQLNEQLYEQLQRRAVQAGFTNVDEYVVDVLQQDLQDETADLDHLFTPQRLAHIDHAAQQIDFGQGLTSEQVREHFRRKRDA